MLGAPYKNVQCNRQLVISGFTKLAPNILKCYCAENEKSQSNMRYICTTVDVCKQQAAFNP